MNNKTITTAEGVTLIFNPANIAGYTEESISAMSRSEVINTVFMWPDVYTHESSDMDHVVLFITYTPKNRAIMYATTYDY